MKKSTKILIKKWIEKKNKKIKKQSGNYIKKNIFGNWKMNNKTNKNPNIKFIKL